MLTALALAAVLAAPVDLEVQLRNEAGAQVTIAGLDGRKVVVEDQKEGALAASASATRLTPSVKGCDYAYPLPQSLDGLRAIGDGPVKILIAEDLTLCWVPFELILYTPPRFLDSQQPGGFPLLAPEAACKS